MFQFTHPGRGATWLRLRGLRGHLCFNSRTPGGVRLVCWLVVIAYDDVSIHALREGCDDIGKAAIRPKLCFNSRTPGGVRRHPDLVL